MEEAVHARNTLCWTAPSLNLDQDSCRQACMQHDRRSRRTLSALTTAPACFIGGAEAHQGRMQPSEERWPSTSRDSLRQTADCNTPDRRANKGRLLCHCIAAQK